MGRLYIFFSFFLSSFSIQVLSSSDFQIGGQVSVAIPPKYQSGFKGRAILLKSISNSPSIKVALSVEAINKRYLCSLVILFDDSKVWASDHLMKFVPFEKCVLELSSDGDLQLKDRTGFIGWRTGTYMQGVKSLHLDDQTGNLLLIDENSRPKWQSFDHPTDTIVWSQQLNSSSRLTAIPYNSSSFYSFEIDQDKLIAYLNWRNNKYSYWQLEPHGNRTIGYARLGLSGLKIFDKNSHKIAQILEDGSQIIHLFALGNDGNLGLYHYFAEMKRFKPSFKALQFCDLPLSCGLYGVCSSQNTCRYLQIGSKRAQINEMFEKGIYNGLCGLFDDRVEMVKLEGVETILRTPLPISNVSEEFCINICKENCSCASVLYSGRDGKCFQFGLVAGAREVPGENGNSFWVKMQKKKDHGISDSIVKKILIIGGVIDAIALFIIVGGLVYYFVVVKRNKTSVNPGTENC